MADDQKARRRVMPLQTVENSLESPSTSSSFGRTDWRLGSQCQRSSDKRQPKTPNGLVLGDFVNAQTKKKLFSKAGGNTKRRINPTAVNSNTQTGARFGEVVRDLSNNSPFVKAEERFGDDFDEMRESLRSERQKIKQNVTSVSLPKIVPRLPEPLVVPSVSEVTNMEKISEAARTYVSYLRDDVSNLATELTFVFDLLATQSGAIVKHFIADPELLSSVHNCSYFAVSVLDSLRDFLTCLNISTLKLLLDMGRIEALNPSLAAFVSDLHLRKLAPVVESGLREENVPFSLETDAKSSFANEGAFRAFKKQRDLFYEVFRVWQEEHTKEDWDFAQVLGSRLRGTLNRHNGPVNGTHLARLFCDQLMASCRNGKSLNRESSGGDDFQLMAIAKGMHPDKFRKLQERFSKPLSRLNSSSGFEGEERFFRDFVLVSNDAYFLEILKCRLTKLVLEWNSFCPRIGDEEVETGHFEEGDERRFLESIKTLRLFAKFLGLVTFAPFQSDKLPDRIEQELLLERSQMHPHWDLVAVLQSALLGGHITLTVPWVIQFLAMADSVTAKLPWYTVAVSYLSSLARSCYLKYLSRNPLGPLLIRFLIGWFLDQPNVEAPGFTDFPQVPPPPPDSIDALPLVTEQVIQACCPFLSSVNRPLTDFLAGNRVSAPTQLSRKITPVAAREDSTAKIGKSLEAELEESFLQCQAPSTKRTIDFVSERLASNVVKQLKTSEIQAVMEEGVREIQKISLTDAGREANLAVILNLAVTLSNRLRKRAEDVSEQLIGVSANSVVTSLLPSDTCPQAAGVCSGLVRKSARSRVSTWMDTNTSTSYFYKELLELYESLEKNPGKLCQIKMNPKSDGSQSLIAKHDLELVSPVDILIAMKDLARDLLNDSCNTSAEFLLNLVTQASQVLGRRSEISTTYLLSMWQLSFDLILTVVIFQPSVMSSEVISHFITYWESLRKEGSSAGLEPWVIFCPRQMILLAQSVAPRQTWDKLFILITKLLAARLVEANLLESQCVQLLKQEWPPELMQRFGTCMRDLSEFIIQQKRSDSKDDETTGHFLDWISWYCGQTEPI